MKTTIPALLWRQLVGEVPEKEYKFLATRRFRIDYYFKSARLAVEIEGGIWTRGRHTRGSGFSGDMEKYNLMTEAGIRLLRYAPNGIDFRQIKRVLYTFHD